MTQHNFFDTVLKNFDFSNLTAPMANAPADVQQALDEQRKNMQSLAEIQQITAQNFQEIAHRQNALFSQIMRNNASIAQDMLNAGKPEDKLLRNSQAMQKNYEQAMESAKEIADLVQKTNSEATNILTKRADESVKKAQMSASKTATTASKTAA